MVCCVTSGFRPWVRGLGLIVPVFLCRAQTFVTVLWLITSQLAMFFHLRNFVYDGLFFSLISFDVGLGNTNTTITIHTTSYIVNEKLTSYMYVHKPNKNLGYNNIAKNHQLHVFLQPDHNLQNLKSCQQCRT